jgi:hypothetical protein
MLARVLIVALLAGYVGGLTQSSLLPEDDVAQGAEEKFEKRQLLGGLSGVRTGRGGENGKPLLVQRTTLTRSSSTGKSSGVERLLDVSQSAVSWDRRAKSHSFQIILNGPLDLQPDAKSVTPDVDVYDLDLFLTETSTIKTLHSLNKTVVCYFSAGTYEPGRPDSALFAKRDMGSRLLEWPKERWLRTGSMVVRRIMANRIQLASKKGCDAIDPDNVGESGFTNRLVRFD